MKKTSTYRVSTYKICIVAFAICINLVGGQIALFLKLPIYLDSIGTVFIASTLGPDLWNASECDQWSVHGNDG